MQIPGDTLFFLHRCLKVYFHEKEEKRMQSFHKNSTTFIFISFQFLEKRKMSMLLVLLVLFSLRFGNFSLNIGAISFSYSMIKQDSYVIA